MKMLEDRIIIAAINIVGTCPEEARTMLSGYAGDLIGGGFRLATMTFDPATRSAVLRMADNTGAAEAFIRP